MSATTSYRFAAPCSAKGVERPGPRWRGETLAVIGALSPEGRGQFFDVLADEFSPSPVAVCSAADAYRLDPSPASLSRLLAAVEPVRQELFRRLNFAPGGTAALVELRRHLLHGLPEHPAWQSVDADLLHLLRSWFNRGFLRMERIDWRTPALLLEKLIAYEAVHAIQGWPDLRRRRGAVIQLELAIKAGDGDFYQASVVETRLRALGRSSSSSSARTPRATADSVAARRRQSPSPRADIPGPV